MDVFISLLTTIFGACYVLFVPGFFLSLVFFGEGKIDSIERLALSFALSISIVPLSVFYVNLLGVPITQTSVFLTVSGILCIIFILLVLRYMKK